VNLDVRPGDFAFVSGGAGAGKTSLIAAATGLCRPATGKLLLGGADYWALSGASRVRLRNARIGCAVPVSMADNDSALLDVVVGSHRTLLGRPKPGAREHAAHLLAAVGLEGRSAAPLGPLTPDERQRVSVARALINNPTVLLADEPTLGMSADDGSEYMTLLHRLNVDQGLTILVTSRDASLSAYASRHILMARGLVIDEITPRDPFTGAAI
jgi:ABC-type lipoprotein export system ATPase subunit